MLFEDRTRAHADHIGQGFERQTTAAVGVLEGCSNSRRVVYVNYCCLMALSFFLGSFSVILPIMWGKGLIFLYLDIVFV